MNREEYVQQLKKQIDQWNAEAASWEQKMKQAQAGMQAEYARQLEQFRARSDAALAEMRRVQGASGDAWKDMMRGADSALKSLQDAFEKARREFQKK